MTRLHQRLTLFSPPWLSAGCCCPAWHSDVEQTASGLLAHPHQQELFLSIYLSLPPTCIHPVFVVINLIASVCHPAAPQGKVVQFSASITCCTVQGEMPVDTHVMFKNIVVSCTSVFSQWNWLINVRSEIRCCLSATNDVKRRQRWCFNRPHSVTLTNRESWFLCCKVKGKLSP